MPKRSKSNREVEIKIRVKDPVAMRATLIGAGAVMIRRVLEQNTLFDTAESAMRRSGQLLRVRIETPVSMTKKKLGSIRGILTSKAPVRRTGADRPPGRYKERLEREVVIAQPAVVVTKLQALGLRPRFRYEKYRTSYHLPGVHVELDETPVGTYLELEGTPAAIDAAADRLGFRRADYRNETYWGVYVADCKRRGVRPTNMLFRWGNSALNVHSSLDKL
ncbi:MAG: class IV adenylate cyclase [Candidatus Acidiferrales bacterium]